jgi:hypothetical protein
VPGGNTGASQNMVTDMKASVDWLVGGKAAKCSNVNVTAMTTMGHSCGGIESMSKAYHDDRVKRIVIMNIGIFQDEKRYLAGDRGAGCVVYWGPAGYGVSEGKCLPLFVLFVFSRP